MNLNALVVVCVFLTLGCSSVVSETDCGSTGTPSTSSTASTSTSTSTSTTTSTTSIGSGGGGNSGGGGGGAGGSGGELAQGGNGGSMPNWVCTVEGQRKPYLTFLPINDPLQNGLNTIARLEVTTDPGCPIGVREFGFTFDISEGVTFDVIGITPFSVNGVDTNKGLFIWGGNDSYATLSYHGGDHLVVTDAANPLPFILELKVNVSGVVSGSSVQVLFRNLGFEHGTKNLYLVGTLPPNHLIFYPANNPGGAPYMASLLWTDFSTGAAHVDTIPSSPDYFGPAEVPGFDGSSLVVAP